MTGSASWSRPPGSIDISDYIVSDRVMAVPEDHARALQLAAALAQSCRLERSQAQIKMELKAAQRAAQLVSTEYQRQQRDRDKLFETALNNMSQGLCMFDGGRQPGRLQRPLHRDVRPVARRRRARRQPARHPGASQGARQLRRRSRDLRQGPACHRRQGRRADAARPGGRRPHHLDRQPRHGQRRLGRDPRGHHRAHARRGAHPPHGEPRQPHRAAEPRRVPRRDGAGAQARAPRPDDRRACASISTTSRTSTTRSAT